MIRKDNKYIFLLLFVTIITFSTNINAKEQNISIELDGREIEFDVAPINENDRILVPFRKIFESMGAKVSWNQKTKTASGIKGDQKVQLVLGSNKAYINEKMIEIDSPPILRNDRTLVPVRFISESFGAKVDWDHINQKVIIKSKEDTYTDPEKIKESKEKMNGLTNGNRNISINMEEKEVKSLLGEPNRIDKALDGVWYIYNNKESTYKDYIQIKFRNSKVVEIQTASKNWKLNDSIYPMSGYKNAKDIISSNQKRDLSIDIELLKVDSDKISFITLRKMEDGLPNNRINTEGTVMMFKTYDEDHLLGLENQIFDYTNVIRVNNGKKPLYKDNTLYSLAKLHSKDMAINNYFSHKNKLGLDFKDRFIEKAKLNFWASGAENLAAGIYNSAGVINEWYNSDIHRINLLEDFNYTSVGVYFNKSSNYGLYFTQTFAGMNPVIGNQVVLVN